MRVEGLTVDQIQNNTTTYTSLLKSVLTPAEYSRFLEWATKTDLFRAPASSRFHSVFVGGLVDHSLGLYEWLRQLALLTGADLPARDMVLATLFHDLCKVDVYRKEFRNRKINGRWQEVEEWVFKENYPMGHGEKSLDIVSQVLHIDLSPAARLAIRHHMGPYELTGIPLRTYQDAVSNYPLVFLVHTADMLEAQYGRDCYGAVEEDDEIYPGAGENSGDKV